MTKLLLFPDFMRDFSTSYEKYVCYHTTYQIKRFNTDVSKQ